MLKRINKAAARKIFENGGVVYICPVNMNPQQATPFEFPRHNTSWWSFDAFINDYIYYNCNKHRGRYPAYYIDE